MTGLADIAPTFRGRRIMVLGSTGFIGRWVARALAACDAELILPARSVTALARVGTQYGFAGEFRAIDLLDGEALRTLVTGTAPTVVFNLAGYGVDPAEDDENVMHGLGVALLGHVLAGLGAAATAGHVPARVVHVGSAAEYGAAGGNMAEDGPCAPLSAYGRAKLAATRALGTAADEHGLAALTARLFTVYGPGEHAGRLLPSLLDAAREGRSVELTSGLQKRDFVYVEDVAEGLLRLASRPEVEQGHRVVNLATGRLTSVRDFAQMAAEALDLSAEALQFGAGGRQREEMVHDPVAIERLVELTGWRPAIDIAAGVRRTREHIEAGL